MEHIDIADSAEKVLLRRSALLQHPVNGTLELLPLCNMHCDMCYIRLNQGEVLDRGGLILADDWIRLGREMAKAGVLFLLLTGGEPLLFPDFRKFYVELKKLGMVLTVNTNGTLLDEEWADFFKKYRPRRINITLYGSDDAAYEKLCHYPGGFSKTVRAIRLLCDRKVDVKINGSVTRWNREDMEAIYRIGRDLNVPVHMDTYMLPGIEERSFPPDQQSRLLPEDAAAAELYVRQQEMSQEDFIRYRQMMLAQLNQQDLCFPDQITCMAGNCSFAISWQGEMRPCVTFEKPAVSVLEYGFEEAWKKISSMSKELKLSEKCVKCRLRPICKTCPASAYLESGSYSGVPEYLCRYAGRMEQLLKKSASMDGEYSYEV